MECIQVQNKLKLLFSKILEPNYVMNNYYVDSLINKLSNCSDPEVTVLRSIPLLSDLVTESLAHINKGTNNTVQVFVIRFLGVASQVELQFLKIFNKQGEALANGFRNISSPTVSTSLRVAYMEVALSLVAHNSGISWLLETGVWKEILSLCNEKHTVFVVRFTYKFITRLLWKLSDLQDENNLRILCSHILKPVQESDLLNKLCYTPDDEEELSKPIQPILNILLSILSEDGLIEKPSLLMNHLVNECNIIQTLHLVLHGIRREDISLLTSKVLFYLGLAKIFLTKPISPSVTYLKDDFFELTVLYYNCIQMYIQRRRPTPVLDYCYSIILVWSSVWKERLPNCDCASKDVNIHNQFLFITLVPCLVFVKQRMGDIQLRCVISDERVNELINKFLSVDCEHTARAAYALRDLTQENDTLTVTLQSVKRLSCLKNHLNNEQANLVFQALFYILQEYNPVDENGVMQVEENMEESQEKVQVITYVLDTVLCLVTNHDINWTESLEVICLYGIVYNILLRRNLSCKFIVAALNVIKVTVTKFLTPNLCLLLESAPGSTMHELGKLIYLKLHDINWEVRDSALELLLVCTEVSYIKFPPFQKQIRENSLINVAAAIAFEDFVVYVQASALKCIGAACKVSALWEQLEEAFPNIHEMLIAVVRDHSEGIVRKEACNVLCDLYQNLKLTSGFKTILYEHMVDAAISDFHWEVQLSSLKFWKTVIYSHFTDQGMLDGNFPPVTFSRETRKIVNLNNAEIQRRLLKILEELSSIGCLTVLVKLLNEDTEESILTQTLAVSMDFFNLLNKYKVPETMKPLPGDVTSVDELIYELKTEDNTQEKHMDVEPEIDNPEKVLEGIVNSDDINLLSNMYENQLKLQNKSKNTNNTKIYRYASPYLFVSHMQNNDFKEIISQKNKWKIGIKNVSSLLDDVLGIYEINHEANSLDCY